MNNEYKIFLVLMGIAAVFGAGVYIYKRGESNTTIAPIPYDTNSNTGNNSNIPQDTTHLSELATNLYNDMSGINFLGNHDETVYNDCLALSNTDFTALYNIWNTKYQSNSAETLTGYLNDQDSLPYTPFATSKAAFLQRLGALNLK